MSSLNCSVSQLIGGLQIDPKWQAQSLAFQQATKEMIPGFLEVLETRLHSFVTLRVWAETRLDLLRFKLEHGFSESLCDYSLELADNEAPILVRETNAKLREAMELLQGLLDGLEDMLEASGIPEREILTGHAVGLSGLALQLYDKKLLTVADLLKLQPSLILA